ncbi:MAG: hypothetical protein HY048_19665 [Acidobacteria bacterium]|nr:hypothetical protein [Acidobacteriota bacterium]
MNWQHLNILAATNYLRERIASGVPDSRAKEVYDGLLDVLDPSRIERRAKGISVDEPVRLPPPRVALRRATPKPGAGGKPDATQPTDAAPNAAKPKQVARRKATAKKTPAKKTAPKPPTPRLRRSRKAPRAKPRRR